MRAPSMYIFTLVFLAALVLTTLTQLWLASRHARHVAAHRDQVPPGFADSITLDAHRKAAGYSVAKTRLGMADTAVGALLLLAFTLGGGLDLLHDLLARYLVPEGYAYGVALIVGVGLVYGIVELPFNLYRVFVIEAKFGFNRMTWKLFLLDMAKQTVLGAAIGIPLLLLVLWLMQRMGVHWWFYVWIVWMGFNLVLLLVYPTVIAPLFNKFTPLNDEALRSRIERLLTRCGFKSHGLFVMDSSRRSSHGNAYFTGFGAAKRIVLFDTLIQSLEPAEVEAVLAHELGHFKHHHVIKRIALLFCMSLGFLALLGFLIDRSWFYSSLGVLSAPGTAMALILFFLVMPVFTFFLQPLSSLYSRKHEFEADAYAARQANPADLVHALTKLYKDNASTLTPDPLHSAFYDSHPPAAMRIARLQQMSPA
jgi:STE24 endopeptidase